MLLPGQLITGRKSISSELNILESEQQIEQQKSNKNRLTTIVNWSLYRSSEQQNEQQVRTSLKRLISTQEIEHKTTSHYSSIKLLKWCDYQSSENENDKPNVTQTTNK